MKAHRLMTLCVILSTVLALSTSASARSLSFEQRVEAQRAIERVYHAHREGATKPFEAAVPDSVLEARVQRTLGQSVALARFWNRPVTAEMLRRETERMVRDSRMPERLEELFAALDHDTVLIQECLARANLVDRLIGTYFTNDDRIHAGTRSKARVLRDALLRGAIDAQREHPNRTVLELHRRVTPPASGKESAPASRHRIELDDEDFRNVRKRLSRDPGPIGRIDEGRGTFVIDVVLDEDVDHVRLARFSVDKLTLGEWWTEVAPRWTGSTLPVVGTEQPALIYPQTTRSDTTGPTSPATAVDSCDGEWSDLVASMPYGRLYHTAIWTGSEMIVWGGHPFSFTFTVWPWGGDAGERYDPATDTWTAIPQSDAPQARLLHTAVWTGTEMIVWGGTGSLQGDRYDPVANTWTTTSAENAPFWRRDHTAVWTGTEMIVWGGRDPWDVPLDSGGRYNPTTDTWTPMTGVDAPAGRMEHSAVWSGSEMIVWGGGQDFSSSIADCLETPGGRYNPATDTWTALSTVGAPTGRAFHATAWTGSEMIVWGGSTCGRGDRDGFATGGRYDPATDSWTATPMLDAPTGRLFHSATWAGDRMVVWGGSTGENFSNIVGTLATGSRYDPATDSWTATAMSNVPVKRSLHTTVWTGTEMIVWGGRGSDGNARSSGGRYNPVSNSWTPTAEANRPFSGSRPVWTGSEMIVWGSGFDHYDEDPVVRDYSEEGARYDPATDSWTPTSTLGTPEGRRGPTLVWTGSEVIVWGGETQDSVLSSGGRYDPAADSWTLTSLVHLALSYHTAVWTGSEMIVWGGDWFDDVQQGARYDPSSDSWTATSLTNAPRGRIAHTAVWTGSEMVVWGGRLVDWGLKWVNTGGRYDPASDTWVATSLTGAPDGRSQHTAVWTGSEMIIWGGLWSDDINDVEGNWDTGGRYDPVTDTWNATSTAQAPSGRGAHTAVWTGDQMIVWGGHEGAPRLGSPAVITGGYYDPVLDRWSPTPMENVLFGRKSHSAVWTGDRMIIRGGGVRAGAALDPDPPDADADGFCGAADCNDADPATHPGASEINDGIDNQCPGDPGHGMVDEVDGEAGFVSVNEFAWLPQSGASSYEAARSTSRDFSSNCTTSVVSGSGWVDLAVPDQAVVFYYLVRAVAPSVGSWGQTSAGVERTVCE